jgi:hypothetical protein
MKTKLLFWGAIFFLALGLNTGDSGLCYFFSIHLFMLFIGVFIHKHASKSQTGRAAEPLPQAARPGRK